ncbi:hypothetical protein KCP75_23440 [Salmonella enterica subsp. enterica]|nr:hypothetical protein KCP75_23440 [Salmonella enterica subsp. enterica]
MPRGNITDSSRRSHERTSCLRYAAAILSLMRFTGAAAIIYSMKALS